MIRKLPVIPTLIVLIAVGIMIRLGFWQLERLGQKEAMLAHYAAVEQDHTVSRWPITGTDAAPQPYSRIATQCLQVGSIAAQSGQNADRHAGWAQVAECTLAQGVRARVVLGWGAQPVAVAWSGGAVEGTFITKDGQEPIIVADPPLAGLAANATPDPRDIPNNHLAYAVQWFLFAGVALVIYVLALRKRR